YASQGGRISIRSSNRDQENLPVMRFSSIIYGRQRPKRWDTTEGESQIRREAGLQLSPMISTGELSNSSPDFSFTRRHYVFRATAMTQKKIKNRPNELSKLNGD
ncbi:MAG: hypothetical protein WBX16_00865, partial [Candidatus Acidiferrales bacterium]